MTGVLRGRTVLISGAARGQGRSHAVRCAREGAHLVLFDVCAQLDTVPFPMAVPADLDETVRLVEAEGATVVAARADVRDAAAVADVVARGVAAFGGIDVVLANAGVVGHTGPSWEVDEQVFRDVVDVNLIGVWHTLKAAVATMVADGRPGSLVVTGSGASVKGLPSVLPYVASKHALVGLVRTMAKELAPHRIRVNAVLPGNVDTDMFNNPAMRALYVPGVEEPTEAEFLDSARRGIPLGVPYVQAADVTEAVLYLASDASRLVTGSLLPVDGGSAIP